MTALKNRREELRATHPLAEKRDFSLMSKYKKCRGIRRANSDRYVAFSLSSVAFSATTSAMGSRHKSLASGAATTQRKTTTSTRAIRHPRGRSQKQERTGVQRPRAIDAERVARRRRRRCLREAAGCLHPLPQNIFHLIICCRAAYLFLLIF